jgi:hypothetical protein
MIPLDDDGLPVCRCRCCGQAFTSLNVFSEAGWIEARVSGLCEVCFDVVSELPRRPSAPAEDVG